MQSGQKGFTLAELLVSIMILGIIAAMIIPRLFQSTKTQETAARIREAVTTIEHAYYNKKQLERVKFKDGILYGPNQRLYDTIIQNLNINNSGPGSSATVLGGATHPCIASAGATDGWVQMNNGLVITGLRGFGPQSDFDALPYNNPAHGPNQNYVICIDINAEKQPNIAGEDIFVGNFNLYGGFKGLPTSESQALKSFNWGNTLNEDVYNTSGTTLGGPTGIGSRTNNPSALVGPHLVNM